jgi:hypothetical protein
VSGDGAKSRRGAAKIQDLRRLPGFAAAIAICAYFLYFAAGAVKAHFALDDMTNLGRYYERGPLRVLLDTVAISGDAYRPVGGLFYLAVYYFAGLNPLPSRILILAIIAANIYFTWQIARWITGSDAAAALAAILACAHGNMVALYCWNSMIYDVLAYFFTALALVLYIGARRDGRSVNFWRGVGIVAAFFAGMNSKEIAVVGAVWIAGYEILVPRPRKLLLPAIVAVVALVFTTARIFGPGALGHLQGYEIELTLDRFVENSASYLNQLFYSEYFTSGLTVLILWIVLTGLCALYRSREMWWCWLLVSTATLPTAFTLVPRDGPSLYLQLFAWSLFIAMIVSRSLPRAGFQSVLQWTAAALIAIVVAIPTISLWCVKFPTFLEDQRPVWSVITQIRDLGPRPPPNSRVIFLENPLPDWGTYFVARLTWRDRSIDIRLANQMEHAPTAADLNSFDWILTFENGNLRVVQRR